MNYARVLLGGLLAGLVLNIGEFLLNGKLLAKQMGEIFSKCGIPQPAPSAFVVLIVITFVLGVVIVFIYAAIRPRCGAGPKTAVCAAIIAWFCVYLYNNIVGAALGFVPTNILFIALAWGLVEYILAAIAGAWVYKEP
jgi:hypothetical protein